MSADHLLKRAIAKDDKPIARQIDDIMGDNKGYVKKTLEDQNRRNVPVSR